jgi:hypothetical protein
MCGVDFADLFLRIDPIRQFRMLKDLDEHLLITSSSRQQRTEIFTAANRWIQFTFIALANLSQQRPKPKVIYNPMDPNFDSHLDVAALTRKRAIYFSDLLDELPIVINSGATFSLSPNRNDFIGPLQPSPVNVLNGLSGTATVQGVGMVEWTIRDLFGITRKIRAQAFYVPIATIRLFSPQAYFQEHEAGQYVMTAKHCVLTLADGSLLEFPYNHESNLPLMLPSGRLAVAGITLQDQQYLSNRLLLSSFLLVADKTNQNLTASQKELLLWHWKLGHASFQWIQQLASTPCDPLDGLGSPILTTKQPRVSSCPSPLCTACQLVKQHCRGPGSSFEIHNKDKDKLLRHDTHLYPGRQVSLVVSHTLKAKKQRRTGTMVELFLLIMPPRIFI